MSQESPIHVYLLRRGLIVFLKSDEFLGAFNQLPAEARETVILHTASRYLALESYLPLFKEGVISGGAHVVAEQMRGLRQGLALMCADPYNLLDEARQELNGQEEDVRNRTLNEFIIDLVAFR